MRRPKVPILLAALTLSLVACGDDYGGDPVETTVADDDVDVDEAAVLDLDQRDVQVDVGDTVVIQLDENASVGDDWQRTQEPDTAVLRFVEESTEATGGDCDGCGGVRHFVYEAVGDGGTTIAAHNCYRCDTEGNSSEEPPEPADVEFSVEVTA